MLEEIIKNLVEETVRKTLYEISIKQEEKDNATMDTKEVAKYIGMSAAWVYQNLDILPHRKIGKKLCFDLREINSFLEKRKVKGEDAGKLSINTKMKKTENGTYKVV